MRSIALMLFSQVTTKFLLNESLFGQIFIINSSGFPSQQGGGGGGVVCSVPAHLLHHLETYLYLCPSYPSFPGEPGDIEEGYITYTTVYRGDGILERSQGLLAINSGLLRLGSV
jgi:hypothetical protein